MLIRRLTIGFWAAFALAGSLRTTTASAAPAPAAADSSEPDDSSDADEDAAAKPASKPDKQAAEEQPAVSPPRAPTPAAVAVSAEKVPGPPESPLTFHNEGWSFGMYGFVELDVMSDSTQSFAENVGQSNIVRPNTVAGDNPRNQFSARNSRLGFKVAAPEWNSINASAVVEMDFFGGEPPATSQGEAYTAGPMRMRHYYAKVESPVVDVLAGQYHDLFGWGGAGFYPNSVAFLPLLGQIYHRNPQFRISKTLKSAAVVFEIAVAAVRPVQRDSAVPDFQGGLKLNVNGWQGAATPGASRPVAAPLSLGLSGLTRRFSVTDFSQVPGNPQKASGWGVAGNLFLPVIPGSADDLSNALSVTAELTTGSGISDMYTGLTGGVTFPGLPNPTNAEQVPTYTPNIDPGIVTFDGSNVVAPVKWTAVVLNGHYHLPIGRGKTLWVSGTYSLLKSDNALALTPSQGRAYVWDKGQYYDANVWWGVTPAVQIGVSFQHSEQTYGDGVVAHNNRGEGAFYLFF